MVTASPSRLLRTKLFLPRSRRGTLSRPRLYERLDAGLEHRLTLISAPAGFGKSTLVAAWREERGGHPPMGWLALDASDNDPLQFWTYVAAAIAAVDQSAAQTALALLQATSAPSVEAVIHALLNGIAELPCDFLLALDDYHLIESPLIHQRMAFFLEQLPPQCHVMLLTRADPPLPLARLRAQRDLLELRARDLRFREEEAGALLGDIALSPADLAALTGRTEGWAAGLQLAALSLGTRTDVAGFITDLLGTNRYIVDYLLEEVLQHLPEEQQQFLLMTALLDGLCGPLCDAVTGMTDSQARLEALEQGNYFTIALDEERRWYRYHHLFATVLQSRLHQEGPERVAQLYRRAADWYAANGMELDAIRAAIAGADHERAAEIATRAVEASQTSSEAAALAGLVDQLPRGLILVRPTLLLAYAVMLISKGQVEASESLLKEGEAALQAAVAGEDEQARLVQGRWLALESNLGRLRWQPGRTAQQAREALAYLPEWDVRWRSMALVNLVTALQASGELASALQGLEEMVRLAERTGDYALAVTLLCTHGEFLTEMGRLHEAHAIYEEALALGAGRDLPHQGWPLVGRARIRYEWNRLEEAEALLQEGIARARRGRHFDTLLRGWLLALRMRDEQGDLAGAQEMFANLKKLVGSIDIPQVQAVLAFAEARLCSALGEWAEAERLVQEAAALGPEALPTVRIYLAKGEPAVGAEILAQRIEIARQAGQLGAAIHQMAARASLQAAAGEQEAALESLAEALALAEPESHLRPFLVMGSGMLELLHLARVRRIAPDFVERLLQAAGPGGPGEPSAAVVVKPDPPTGALGAERLTEREQEVLRMIAAGLSSEEIAAQGFIAPGTVKRHIHNILGKLGAGKRREAVRIAQERGWL